MYVVGRTRSTYLPPTVLFIDKYISLYYVAQSRRTGILS